MDKVMSKTDRAPLNPEQKLQAVQSGERSLRDIGDELGVHHSSIKAVRQEAAEVLSSHWQEKSKRIGRPKKEVSQDSEALQRLQAKADEAEEQLALKQMRIDWLELKLKWREEELREAKVKRAKQLKKKRKKR
jgi:hypothetical protein